MAQVAVLNFECWLNKVVEWGQTTTLESQQDVCLHLPKLQEFLLQIYETLKHMNLLCHLFSSSELGSREEFTSIDSLGCTTADYYGKLFKNTISSLIKQLKGNPLKLSADHVRAMSVTCVPILTLPEVAPLLEALLAYHGSEPKEVLDDQFLDHVNDAVLRKKIVLSELAVLNLWLRHLPSLEKAALDLFQRLIAIQSKSLREMEHMIQDSLLPQAACHPSIFRIVDDIFRHALLEADGNHKVMTIIQFFTHCFIQVYQKDNLQPRFPLRTYFPRSNIALVMALLRQPLGLPSDACLQHLQSIIKMLKIVDNDERSHGSLFETWFLLIHFGDWVDIAAEQLLTSGSETSDDLLWLLAFYYNPCNENQQRSKTMVEARAVYDRLLMLQNNTPVSASPLQNAVDDGNKAKNFDPCTIQFIRHLCVSFLLFSPGWHAIAKEFIAHMTQAEEAANEVSDVLARIVYRLDIPGMRNQKIVKIAHELLQGF
ncbi:Fanconi anemia group C protein isoform X2 [Ascaphus truei]|uniref:Fanconi anemia group C protein isoform X2 n=1 Tax=Ascaphus truei TaxID=8439 RepID=UPI003F5A6C71